MLPLDVSPVATFLVGLAERRPSGTVSLVARALQLVSGEIVGIGAVAGDPSFGEFLVQSERLTAAAVSDVMAHAKTASIAFDDALIATGKLSKPELKSLLRACWLDRFVRELRVARAQPKLVPTLDVMQRVSLHGAHPAPLLSFVLDAWTRLAVDADAAAVGMRIDFRLVWVPGPLLADAQRWASLPDLQERPVVSAVLGRVPAAAAEIAALVRAGFVRLTAPGAQPAKPRSRKDTLPPPPPRLVTLSDLPSLPPTPSTPPLALATSSAPPPPNALASLRPSAPPPSVRPSARSSHSMPSIPAPPPLPRLSVLPSARTSQNMPAVGAPPLASGGSVRPSARSSQNVPAIAEPTPLPAAASVRPSARTAQGLPAVSVPSPLPEPPPPPSGRPAAPPPAPSLLAAARPSPRPQAAVRAPRLQLQPGGAGGEIEAIPEVQLPQWPEAREPLHDPLRELELSIAELEEQNAPGPERARAFIQLAALWQSRIGSLEHATRALREAAAADPDNAQVLLQTARQCGALGQVSLALAYARAVAYTAGLAAERAAGHRALADLHAAQGETDGWLEALAEAAAEDPENPEPHELLAQLHYERGHVSLAIAHAQRAAAGFSGRTAKRALGWYAVSYAWDPSDPALCEKYRSALDAVGLIDAAVAVSAETARNAPDPELRRNLRLDTAHFARARGRSDLAADLLLESYDDDPSSADYAQLDSDFAKPELAYEHCALLESIVRECAVEDKSQCWARYAQVLADLPDSGENTERALWFAQRYADDPDGAPFEVAGFIEQLEARLAELAGGPDESAALNELCGWHLLGGDLRRSISCALRVAALEPETPLAAARFWRATSLRKDGVLAIEALTWLARTQSGAPQLRSLCALARDHEAQGDFDAALSCAEAALALQPSAAEAAIVALRHAHRLPPPRAAALLAQLRGVFGCCPPLSLALAEAARAAGDRELALRAIEELVAQQPLLHEPRLWLLELHATHDEPAQLLAAALGLLAHSADARHVAKAEAAVLRLAELGATGQAARLAQHVLDARCRADLAYATSAAELARASGDRELSTLALERVVSLLHGAAQIESLAGLAEHHRRREDRVAEVRAWLRVLSLSPGQPDALEHLTRLFAESGDASRLLVVLSMGLEAMSDPEQRRQRLLDMASAAAQVGADRERAAVYIAELFTEVAGDREWLRQAVGALFALGEPDWALREARALAETLPADAGAAVCLWLAHHAETVLGDARLALAIASDGARQFPETGELLLIAERLSLALRDRESAVSLYDALIESAVGDHGRRSLAYRAGRWLERTGSYDEALDRYSHAFQLARTTGVAYKALERVARASKQLLPLAQAQETLAELVPDERSRLGLLREAARTSLVDLGDPERSFRNLLKADALTPIGELDGTLREVTQRIGERDGAAREQALRELAETRQARAEQLWDGEPKAKLLLNAARLHLSERNDPEASAAALSPFASGQLGAELPIELQRDSLLTLAHAQLGAGRPAEALAAVERALQVAPGDREASELHARLTRPAGAPPSREELLERVRGPVLDLDDVRLLHDQEHDGAALVAAQILGLFDPAAPAPTAHSSSGELLSPPAALEFVHEGGDPELRQLMRVLWECVRSLPQLRRTPESLGLPKEQRVQPDDHSALGAAFAHCRELFGVTEVELFSRPDADSALEIWPAEPPCIVARSDFSPTPALLFRLAQCVVLAEPEHALVSVLPEPDARALLAALRAAFAPPGAATELDRAGKDLASQLWHAVPARMQSELRDRVHAKLPLLVYERLREQAAGCAVRAGLLAAGNLRSALEGLVREEPELRGAEIHEAAGFAAAFERSPALRELIRAAFSERYLAQL